MKNVIQFSLMWMFIMSCSVMFAQNAPDMKYRRASLDFHFIRDIDNLNRTEQAEVLKIMREFEMPTKYNNHTCGDQILDLSYIQVSAPEQKKKGFLGITLVDPLQEEKDKRVIFQKKIDKYIEEENVGAELVAKWFNLSNVKENGSFFNMNLIQDRGAYSASQLEKLRSQESLRGENLLKDAGMDLIPYTYCVFVRISYETYKEQAQKQVEYYQKEYKRCMEMSTKASPEMAEEYRKDAQKASEKADLYRRRAAEDVGYSVYASTYLYQLVWDEEISNDFLTNVYASASPEQALNAKGKYKLKFIDMATHNTSMGYHIDRIEAANKTAENVFGGMFGETGAQMAKERGAKEIKQKFSEEEAINCLKSATYYLVEKTLATLQKKHDDFKVKSVLADVNGKEATSFIGTKESITAGSKFAVLQLKYDEAKNIYRYVKVGTIKADGKRIWDNAYKDEYTQYIETQKQAKGNPNIDRTYFTGASPRMVPGMVIKQEK